MFTVNEEETIPWRFIRMDVAEHHESFVVAELTAVLVALLSVIFIFRKVQKGEEGRKHALLFFCSVVGGIGADAVFTSLDLVDNFWHAQASVMISARLPLYLVFYYVGWFFIPLAIIWRLELPPLAESGLAALLCLAFYWPWDVVGAKLVWWTWHDSDSPLGERFLHVPFASTMFVMVQSFCWARLVRFGMDHISSKRAQFVGVPLFCCLTVPGLVIVMTSLQILFTFQFPPPAVSAWTTAKTALLMAIFAFSGMMKIKKPSSQQSSAWFLQLTAYVHFLSMAACAVIFDPVTQRSTGVHQQFGPCEPTQSDIQGTRNAFVCEKLHLQRWDDYKFRCVGQEMDARDGSRWYTICGTNKTPDWKYHVSLLLFCSFSFFLAIHSLTKSLRKPKED